MKIMITGYGAQSDTDGAKRYSTMRLLTKREGVYNQVIPARTSVRVGKKNIPALRINAVTRKTSQNTSDNEAAIYLHSMSPDDALTLAIELIGFSTSSLSGGELKAFWERNHASRSILSRYIYRDPEDGWFEEGLEGTITPDEFERICAVAYHRLVPDLSNLPHKREDWQPMHQSRFEQAKEQADSLRKRVRTVLDGLFPNLAKRRVKPNDDSSPKSCERPNLHVVPRD
ncbi:hypothetical protein AB9K35_07655 [Leisingera sp. XS_AS12]|uniref:hypothetical protein n=1 Tax=Leisingera sp. XS_AS12 TaxID=3241294 RepID=UPI00351209D4